MNVISPKKLIEVALPLDKINAAAAREKSIRHGHPSTLHLWWARRPLAAARAVIFGQLVHDPEDLWRCQNPGKEPNAQVRGHWTKARARLFRIIEDLVLWENTTNENVLNTAREAIRESWRQTCELNKDHPRAKELFDPDKMPGLHDPFAGGGSIPLEAQRLGLEAYASDLNPVAVLINKAMIEIPPKFAGRPPVNPDARAQMRRTGWHGKGAQGLAEDVRYYGKWMRDEAEKRIGHLYPKVEITPEMARERPDLAGYVGQKLTVIAWLWARRVKSPNPVFSHVDVPLASTFILSSKAGKEAWVEPVIEKGGYRFTVKVGTPPVGAKEGTKLARGANFRCLMSGTPIGEDHIKSEGCSGRMGAKMIAVVAEGTRGRVYLAPTHQMETVAESADTTWKPDLKMPRDRRWFSPPLYGMPSYGDLFTPRQLAALTTFSDLVTQARERVKRDALGARIEGRGVSSENRPLSPHSSDLTPLAEGGSGARAYAEAVSVYLGFVVDKCSDYWSSICSWHSSKELIRNTFGRQAIPMMWDYAQAYQFCSSSGNWTSMLDWTWKALASTPAGWSGIAAQADAQNQSKSTAKFVSTDPPYYDNIGYADLSDFVSVHGGNRALQVGWTRGLDQCIAAEVLYRAAAR
ncbi:MAG: DUF1156 domain-containing protein [Candidatus Schekmanbacteria bacterium]|nr:DUF1156 domain-containing protein [Candidatus Schekmanbacteria bacterium]